jgi:hypothetical protein
MKLPKTTKSLDSIDSKYRHLYKKVGDTYTITAQAEEDDSIEVEDDTEGEDAGASGDLRDRKIREMRANNIALMKRLGDLEKRYEGVDVEQYQQSMAALEQARSQEERDLMAKGKFNEVLERRTTALRDQFQKELAKLTGEAQTYKSQAEKFRDGLKKTKIESLVRSQAERAKLRLIPTGIPDVMNRAMQIFDLDDNGNPVAFEVDGDERVERFNAENRPYGMNDFFQSIIEEASHLIEGAEGTDVRGGSGRSRGRAGVLDIDLSDPRSMGNNLENIASGKVDVRVR